MIARLTGTLVDLDGDRALIAPGPPGSAAGGGAVYEAYLPAFTATRLAASIGQTVTLHTLLYFESTAQGAAMFPRLFGFVSAEDKAFFELFVSVKGIGHRRALRAMVLDPGTVAAAIADRDVKLLQTMPEVGKKLAETIVVTLKDKVDAFVAAAAYPASGAKGGGASKKDGGGGAGRPSAASHGTLARDALEVLLQLGEQRTDAVILIDRVLAADDAPREVQDVIEAVYRLKAGA